MQKTRLRKFIIVSVAFHVVVISAILLYLYHNPLPNNDSGTVMVGVISGTSANSAKTSDSDTKDLKQVKKTDMEQVTKEKTIRKNIRTDTPVIKRPTKKSIKQKTAQQPNQGSSPQGNNQKQEVKGIKTASITYQGNSGQGQDIGSQTASANSQLAYPNYNINPKPKYPRVARKRGYEGEVKLKVFVLESGKVGRIEVIRPSGYKILDDSALEAVKNWVFIPGKQNGKEISSWVTVPINFQLKSG